MNNSQRGYTAYVISSVMKEALVVGFPPAHEQIYGDHITEQFKVVKGPNLDDWLNDWFHAYNCKIIDYYKNDEFDVFTCSIDNSLMRPDMKPYHLTWSKSEQTSKGPKDSIEAIRPEFLVKKVNLDFKVLLKFFPF